MTRKLKRRLLVVEGAREVKRQATVPLKILRRDIHKRFRQAAGKRAPAILASLLKEALSAHMDVRDMEIFEAKWPKGRTRYLRITWPSGPGGWAEYMAEKGLNRYAIEQGHYYGDLNYKPRRIACDERDGSLYLYD